MLLRKYVLKASTFAFGVSLFFTAQWFCKKQTAGFTLPKIRSTLTYNEAFVAKEPSFTDEIDSALSGPYYFLGKGAQSFVFASKDNKWVIKFFKHSSLRPSIFVYLLPKKLREQKIQDKSQELYRDFLSYKLAYDLLAEETGLVFVHLNKSCHLNRKVTIYDKLNIAHTIDLDSMEFLVQKRAELFYSGIEALIEKKETDTAKKRLIELVNLLQKRSELGLYDKDPDINTNFGICSNKTIQIDVGRYRIDASRKDPRIYVNDMLRATDNLHQWLATKDPELAKFLKTTILSLAP